MHYYFSSHCLTKLPIIIITMIKTITTITEIYWQYFIEMFFNYCLKHYYHFYDFPQSLQPDFRSVGCSFLTPTSYIVVITPTTKLSNYWYWSYSLDSNHRFFLYLFLKKPMKKSKVFPSVIYLILIIIIIIVILLDLLLPNFLILCLVRFGANASYYYYYYYYCKYY